MKILRAIGAHILAWLEVYFWIPASIGAVLLALYFAKYLQHGHPVEESASWIYDLATRLVPCIVLVVLLSITRQATGVWLTKEEQMDHPWIATLQTLKTCFFAAAFIYLLSH
jgi:hypothetical protein